MLFRDRSGQGRLPRAALRHRGTSLEYGRVEQDGIRCCYHGWLFDTAGRVLRCPARPPGRRPPDGRRAARLPGAGGRRPGVRLHRAARTRPQFSDVDIADRRHRQDLVLVGSACGATRIGYVRDCNWLQHLENVVDPWHLIALHTHDQRRPVQAG